MALNIVANVKQAQDDIKRLDAQLEGVSTTVTKLDTTTKSLTKSYKALIPQVSSLQAKSATLSKTLASLQKSHSGLVTTVTTLKTQMAGLQAQMATLTAASLKNAAATKTQSAAQLASINANTNARAAVRGLAGAMGGLWLSYNNILPVLATFTAALTAIKSIKISSEFAYTTKYISALNEHSGQASLSLGEIRDELTQIENTRHGVTELAMGMKEFAKAGVDTALSIGQMAEMSRFASVAEMGLADAIGLVIGQANAFGVSYSNAANMITASATNSATSIGELATAMSYTTELGSVSKVEFNEVATAMAVLANAGIRGSKAGTSLRTSILRMQVPTEKLKGMLENLNVEWEAFTEDGKVKSVKAMFSELEKSMVGLTDKERVEILKELFGLRSIKGGANVLAQISTNWDRIAESVNNAAEGTTLLKKVSDDLMNTSQAKLELLAAEWENFLNSAMVEAFSMAVLEAARSVVHFADTVINLPEIMANWTAGAILQDVDRVKALFKSIRELMGLEEEEEPTTVRPLGLLADDKLVKRIRAERAARAEEEKAAASYQPTIFQTLGIEASDAAKSMSVFGDFANLAAPFQDTFDALEKINKYNSESDQAIIKQNEEAKKAQEERLHYAEYASERMIQDRWLVTANYNKANAEDISASVQKAEEQRQVEADFATARKALEQEVLEEKLTKSGQLYDLEIMQADRILAEQAKITGLSLENSELLLARKDQLYAEAAAKQLEREREAAAEELKIQIEKVDAAIEIEFAFLDRVFAEEQKNSEKRQRLQEELSGFIENMDSNTTRGKIANLERWYEKGKELLSGHGEDLERLNVVYAEKSKELTLLQMKEKNDLGAQSSKFFDEMRIKYTDHYHAIGLLEHGWGESVKASQSVLGDFFVETFGGIEGVWGGLWDSMLKKFADTLVEMAALWAKNKLMKWLTNPEGEGGEGGGFFGGILGGLGKALSSIFKGGEGGEGGGIFGMLGGLGKTIAGIFKGGGEGGGGGGILGGIGAAIAGIFKGGGEGGGILGGIGKAIGGLKDSVGGIFGKGGGQLGGIGGALTAVVGAYGGVKKMLSGDGSIGDIAKTAKDLYTVYDKGAALVGGMGGGMGGAAAAAATSTNLALGNATPAILNAYAATQMGTVGGTAAGVGATGAATTGVGAAGMGGAMAGGIAMAPIAIGMMARMLSAKKDRTPLEIKLNRRGGVSADNIAIGDTLSEEMDEAVRSKLQRWSVDKQTISATSMNREAGVAVIQREIGGGTTSEIQRRLGMSGDGGESDPLKRNYTALKMDSSGAWRDVSPTLRAMVNELDKIVPATEKATEAQALQIAEQYKMPELADEVMQAHQDMQDGLFNTKGGFSSLTGTMTKLGVTVDKENAMMDQMAATMRSMGDSSDAAVESVAAATAEMYGVPQAAQGLATSFRNVGKNFHQFIRDINRPKIDTYNENPDTGGYATGTSYVPVTGPYILHKGEKVLTPGQSRQEDKRMEAVLVAVARFSQKTADALERIERLGIPPNARIA